MNTIDIIESIIVDVNNLPRALFDGQYIQFCAIISQMGQKLKALTEGVKSDIDSKNRTIETLKQQLRNMEGCEDGGN